MDMIEHPLDEDSSAERHTAGHQERQAAGAACYEAAKRLHAKGLSPLLLCDPGHLGVAKVSKAHVKECKRPGKVPLLPHKWKPYQDRQPTDAELAAWFEGYRYGNVSLVLGVHIVRIDVDSELANVLLLEWSAGDLPETWTFLSPSTDYYSVS